MPAKYFDGKSSKPYAVNMSYQASSIHIMGVAPDVINRYWQIADCSIESLNSGNNMLITYGDFPKESLQFQQEDYPALAAALIKEQNRIAQTYQHINRLSPIKLVVASASLVVGTVFLYFQFISPWVGEQAVRVIPKSVEITMGESIANNFIAMADVDTLKSEWLTAFFESCNYTSEYPVELTYLQGDVVNAFAAPGGQIVVYEDMLQLTENSNELAGLLAHELAHVNQRHSMKTLARSFSSYLVLSVLTGDVGGISGVILEQANSIKEMANSRSFEREADELGLGYMIDNQIDPNGMVQLFENLLAYSTDATDSLSFIPQLDSLSYLPKEDYLAILSSHPTSEQRITYLNEQLKSIQFVVGNNSKRDSLWQLLKTNVWEEEAEEEVEIETEN